MNWLNEVNRRLRVLFRRDSFDADLDEEMRAHIEMQAEENRDNGMDPADARYAAQRQFGNAALLKEDSRGLWSWLPFEAFIQDARFALRSLRRNPGFAFVAILSLALGIGVNTAIFSILDNLLFRPLPVPESDRLVSLQHRGTTSELWDSMSLPDYLYYRDHNNTFAGLAAHDTIVVSAGEEDHTARLDGEIVSANYFDVLGITPVIGRWFAPEEDQVAGANPIVVISYGLWQRQFGGDSAALGQQMTINRYKFTVIGVAPKGFTGLPTGGGVSRAEFWVPTAAAGEVLQQYGGTFLLRNWGNHWVHATGRLKTGLSVAQAETLLHPVSDQLRPQWSSVWGKDRAWRDNPSIWTPALVPAAETRIAYRYRHSVATFLWMLAGIVGLVLLMACVNVAGLVITKVLKQRREIAVRFSLGAPRSRIVRQMLMEGLFLAAAGCALGLLVARAAAGFIASFQTPFRVPLAMEASLDIRILVFAVTLSLVCVVVTSLIPARHGSQCDLASAMKGDSAGSLSGMRSARLRGVLVAVQVSLSFVFLAGAGLFVRTLMNARAADITVDPGNVLLTRLDLKSRNYDQARGQAFFDTLLDRLQSIRGVKGAALVLVVPLGGVRGGTDIKTPDGAVQVDFNAVSPNYFEMVGIPIVRGQGFTRHDRAGSTPVVLVNERFAQRYFGDKEPIGEWIDLTFPNAPKARVVGVVRDGPFQGVRAPVKPCFYLPQAQHYWPFYSGSISLEVRTAEHPEAFAPVLRREILALDKDLALGDILTLRSHREAGLAQERLIATLLTAFATLALLLAAIGVYGIISFAVTQRTRELGLRMALGADATSVLRLVLSHSVTLIVVGLAIGLCATLLLTRFVSSLLYGVRATDPVTFVGVFLTLLLAALAATWIPARRATRIDPMEALRHE